MEQIIHLRLIAASTVFKLPIFLMFWAACSVGAGGASAQIADPSDIADLLLWHDANDVNGDGTTPANGATVTAWADLSGNGNDLTAAPATAPSYESAGFDGINPGLRFEIDELMTAANPFGGAFQDEVTLFFVNANVTLTTNFSFSLNGFSQSTNPANGRFSFHTPWANNQIYFDAGACCGATRLQGVNPNALTETTLYSAQNDQPGSSQLLRIDGLAFRSDASAISTNVAGGLRIGDSNTRNYDGRFAEIIVYDRALSLAEIQDVECFLLNKWKPAAAPAHCTPTAELTASKSVSVWDPAGAGLLAVPGNDVVYTIRVEHVSGSTVSADSLFLVDSLPPETVFYNDDIDDAGPEINPVAFTQSGTSLTFAYGMDVRYSDALARPASMGDCNDVPDPGYDDSVRHICIRPQGTLSAGNPNPFFEVSFRVRVD